MAQIDPSIAMGYKMPQFQDPVAAAARVQEFGVNALKMNEMQRGIETQNKLREAFAEGVDPSTPEGFKRLAAVDPATALKLRTDALQGQKLQGDIKKTGFEIDAKKMDLFRERIGNLEFNPSNANIQAHLEDSVKRGEITPEQANQQFAQATAVPLAQRPSYFRNLAVKVEKRYEMNTISAAQQQTADIAREGQKLTYSAATQPVFSEASGGFYTRPTGGNAAEFIPASGTDMTTKGKSVNIAKQNVTTLASEMAQGYKNLLDKKAIKSTEAGAASNLSASSQSSMAGQILGGVFGTEEQDIRDYVKSQRPLLVQAMVKATGMSAQQINSNAELKNMLDAATDPGRGYESNIRALNGLNTMFGTGTPILPSAPVTPALAPAAKPTLESIFAPAKK